VNSLITYNTDLRSVYATRLGEATAEQLQLIAMNCANSGQFKRGLANTSLSEEAKESLDLVCLVFFEYNRFLALPPPVGFPNGILDLPVNQWTLEHYDAAVSLKDKAGSLKRYLASLELPAMFSSSLEENKAQLHPSASLDQVKATIAPYTDDAFRRRIKEVNSFLKDEFLPALQNEPADEYVDYQRSEARAYSLLPIVDVNSSSTRSIRRSQPDSELEALQRSGAPTPTGPENPRKSLEPKADASTVQPSSEKPWYTNKAVVIVAVCLVIGISVFLIRKTT
jgi:hypothetical protein